MQGNKNETGSKIVCSEVIFAFMNAFGKIEQTQYFDRYLSINEWSHRV